MKIRILSRESAECYQPESVEICVSISDPGAAPAQLSPAFASVLRLAFNDIESAQSTEDVLFAAEHAAAILEFAEQWAHVEQLVIHCNAGASRSPGVALGLCDVFGWPTEELERSFPFWNRWIRRVIAQQLGEQSNARPRHALGIPTSSDEAGSGTNT